MYYEMATREKKVCGRAAPQARGEKLFARTRISVVRVRFGRDALRVHVLVFGLEIS
jgi:hypothetical protein